ncbi:hypothetical protein LXL04_003636 [Taraxacum kok-saghyz]
MKTLSIGGRHTLVNIVLGSLGNFWFSMFKAPKSVIKDLEAIRRRFFWGENEEGKSIPWVRWEEALKNKEDGGLGICSLEKLNTTLIAKWIWRYRTEPDAIWVKVIDSIHGPDPLFTKSEPNNCNSNWMRIIKCMKNLDQFDLDTRKIIRKRSENGRKTQFWEDSWLLEKPLREVYPRLYNLEINKNCLVADRCLYNNCFRWQWRFEIRNGRTGEELKDLEEKVRPFKCTDKEDWRFINEEKQDRFSTAWFREMLYKKEEHQPSTKNLWLNWIPKKRILFAWRALKGRIPVRVVLDKMEVDIPDIKCCICKNISESVSHVLVSCEWAIKVWQGIGNCNEAVFQEVGNHKCRNAKKRDARRSFRWGMELAELNDSQIKRILRVVSLEEEVFDAIMLVKSYGFNLLQKLGRDVREGKRRQFSFIGKLLRDVEPDLMEGLIKAMKDSDFQKFQELSGASDKSDPVDITEVEEETGDEEEEEDEGRLGDIASRWFDGLVNKDIDITNEIYSLSTVEFDRQELRKLVRTFCSMQSATSATETETDVKVLKAKRQLTRFLLSLAKQLPTEENYIL